MWTPLSRHIHLWRRHKFVETPNVVAQNDDGHESLIDEIDDIGTLILIFIEHLSHDHFMSNIWAALHD